MTGHGSRLPERYRILRRLGGGGQGVVYAAHDEVLNREVAIKVLAADSDPGHLARFQREAQVLAMIKHPNVVSIFDLGWHDGGAFVVMEQLTGPDLGRIQYDAGCLPVTRVLHYTVPVADALTRLHQPPTPVVHRDIKPQNLVLDGDGTVKVCDFGLAALPEASLTRLTEPGVPMGTAAYMSPEQCRGDDPGTATDIYSFGAVLYSLLAGGPPFAGPGPFAAYARRIIHDVPDSIVDYCPDVPPDLADLIHGMLAKEPATRPTAGEVHDALRALAVSTADPRHDLVRERENPTGVRLPVDQPDPAYDPAAGELLLSQGRYAEANRFFTALAHRLRADGLDADPRRFAAELGRVRSRYGLGDEEVAALRLIRLVAGAEAALGPDHPQVREIRAYLDLKSRPGWATPSPSR